MNMLAHQGPLSLFTKVQKAPQTGAVTAEFKGYDLRELGVPEQAWPVLDFPYKGSKSYTVRSRSGAVP